jgi:hypothetical protein
MLIPISYDRLDKLRIKKLSLCSRLTLIEPSPQPSGCPLSWKATKHYKGEDSTNFYHSTHGHYCGIDLQARHDEIVRRVSKVKSGKATLLSREEFRSKMRARLGQ